MIQRGTPPVLIAVGCQLGRCLISALRQYAQLLHSDARPFFFVIFFPQDNERGLTSAVTAPCLQVVRHILDADLAHMHAEIRHFYPPAPQPNPTHHAKMSSPACVHDSRSHTACMLRTLRTRPGAVFVLASCVRPTFTLRACVRAYYVRTELGQMEPLPPPPPPAAQHPRPRGPLRPRP